MSAPLIDLDHLLKLRLVVARFKWTERKTPTRSIDGLVRERTSPTVKSALKSLLGVPSAVGAAKKQKKRQANA